MVLPEFAWVVSALTFAVAMSATPGPNNTMVTASGATWGYRRTVPHMLGIAVGFPAMLVVVALGAGEIVRARPWLFEALRWMGAAYLLFLAWRIATARPAGAESSSASRPLGFLQAALFQWVNPKAWIIAVGSAVTYADGSTATAMLLAAIFFVVSLPTSSFWTLVGVGAARLLRTPRALRRFNLAMAALLVASLVSILAGE